MTVPFRRHRHVAVIPSLKAEPDALVELTAALTQAGVRADVVVTGGRLHRQLTEQGIPHLCTRQNPGFSRTVRHVADAGDWDWLYIANDDITILDGFVDVVARLDELDPAAPLVQFLDPEPKREIPTLRGVFLNISLLARFFQATPRGRGGAAAQWYKSFSFVAISRGAWEALGGLNASIIYTYEDADFIRRAWAAGVDVRDGGVGVSAHEGSRTSNSLVGTVLPVSVHSAGVYLRALGYSEIVIRGVLSAALVIRLVVSWGTKTRGRLHVQGIVRSLTQVWSARTPSLPRFEVS